MITKPSQRAHHGEPVGRGDSRGHPRYQYDQPKVPQPQRSGGGRYRPLDSSESFPSEESSIFNAIVASSASENALRRTPAGEQVSADLAANLAMFIPLTPPLSQSGQRPSTHPFGVTSEEGTGPTSTRVQWPSHDSVSSLRSRHAAAGRVKLKPTFRRKAASLSEVDNKSRVPKWPSSDVVSPVSPNMPRCPPPVRTPTPPGLPSFGTHEAVRYSAQFTAQPRGSSARGQQRQTRQSRRRDQDNHGRVPYGNAVRAFLGLGPSSARPLREEVPVIGRAEDGTAVQGRFPYRQSGHGMNIARHLQDHPFHRRTLPVAHSSEAAAERDATVRSRRSWREDSTTKDGSVVTGNPLPPRHDREIRPYASPAAPRVPESRSTIGGRQPSTHTRSHLAGPCDAAAGVGPRQAQLNTADEHGSSYLDVLGISGDTLGRYPTESRLPAALQSPGDLSRDGREQSDFWDGYRRMASAYCCCWPEDADRESFDVDSAREGNNSTTAGGQVPDGAPHVVAATECTASPNSGRSVGRRLLASLRAVYDSLSLEGVTVEASLL